MAKLKAATAAGSKVSKMKLHKQIALGKVPKKPIVGPNAVAKRK